MDRYSYLNTLDNSVIEELYDKFQKDPASVEESWRKFFEGFEFCRQNYKSERSDVYVVPDEFKVINLINGYRLRGHLFTRTNPVRTRRKYTPTLDLENFGLSTADLARSYQAGKEIGIGTAKLSEILDRLNRTYCASIGAEFLYIRDADQVSWLKQRMETNCNTPAFSLPEKTFILEKLARAVLFEKFIHKKFTGQKSFSLEGVESLIPALAAVTEKGAELGAAEFIIGMAHRGRLNVLANILRKPVEQIFSEFEGKEYEDAGLLGDVKYHLGYTTKLEYRPGRELTLSLAPNPSHLEAADPVVEGLSRARIDSVYEGDASRIVPILVHGDASISGQGIVYEVLQMAELGGYKTGGTIHLVVNNQLGFTTNYLDGRSSTYCTDVAKTLLCPVFHVNADDVEAVVYTVMMAMEFRGKFHKDVFIDLLGYRKWGHNESDEPRFTQPILYKIIEQHPDPLEICVNKLQEENTLASIDLAGIRSRIQGSLEQAFEASKGIEKGDITPIFGEIWKNFHRPAPDEIDGSPETGVSKELLLDIANKITSLPEAVPFFKKIQKLQSDRNEMVANDQLDWAMGELLAYGSLLKEGHPVRISGQDTQRGTFSHRHAVLTVEDSEEKYIPLDHLGEQAPFRIWNSPLSEYGVLGFEYGYALANPEALVIWEAQFGDFSNGAQVIIDQYLSSAEDKWKLMNGLVLYLPHGYEGQGPEHSSARLERFLNLCGHKNMQIVNITTPANLFHVLRRQIHRPFRKPLVVFTPKSLLRHPKCVSSLDEFTNGGFREVIDDGSDPSKVKKVIFCTGKVYYDLAEEKEKQKKEEIAVVRLEQLYPLPQEGLKEILTKYKGAKTYEWIQEEPVNMGAWQYISLNFRSRKLIHTARPPSGSPATGSSKLHKIQQRILVEKALGQCTCKDAFGSCRLHCADDDTAV
jgi:2-oxoglutarate dehydrogenase E1 component